MRAAAAIALVLLCGLTAASAARSQSARTPGLLRARGVFLEYDAEGRSLSLRERGTARVYFLLAEDADGETEVSIEGDPARVSDLRSGAPTVVYWRPDPADAARRVAHKIEVPRIPKSYREDLR